MDHGEINPNALTEGVDEARKLIDDLREAGVDYGSVVEVLEQEGVQKFADSFDELLEVIGNKSRQVKSQSAGQPVSS